MKNKGKTKNGISLIVLVITIIVMIILAGAIILSLNSSGIIGRANEARNKSDMANKKEAVNMFAAEYEMKLSSNEIDPGEVTLEDYIKQRMEEEGLDSSDVVVTEDGKVVVSPSGIQAEKAGVQVGATVLGYTVTEKSYTTSGKEVEGKNTYSGANTEYAATPATIKNKTDFTWKYIGNDKNGNMLITPDVSGDISTWPTMTFKAQGAYLYGPAELNNACKTLYSTNRGTARSMNIDDVNMILGYTGPKGYYYNTTAEVYTDEPLTIKEIGEKLSTTLTNTKTPDGKEGWDEIGKYKSDYYDISKSSDKITNKDNISLVYPSSGTYWLASPCVRANFDYSYAFFSVRYVRNFTENQSDLFISNGNTASATYALRPVVALTSDIQISYDADTNTCTIK